MGSKKVLGANCSRIKGEGEDYKGDLARKQKELTNPDFVIPLKLAMEQIVHPSSTLYQGGTSIGTGNLVFVIG